MKDLDIWLRFENSEQLASLSDEELAKALASWQASLDHYQHGLISSGANLDRLQKEQARRQAQRADQAWEATRPERERLFALGEQAKAAGDEAALAEIIQQLDAARRQVASV